MPEQSFTFKLPRSNLLIECAYIEVDTWQLTYHNLETGKKRPIDRTYNSEQTLAIQHYLVDCAISKTLYV